MGNSASTDWNALADTILNAILVGLSIIAEQDFFKKIPMIGDPMNCEVKFKKNHWVNLWITLLISLNILIMVKILYLLM
jgi:hypothetical protein